MNIPAAEKELAEFLVNLEKATWNRPRTTEELRSFLSSRNCTLDSSDEAALAFGV